ncbi:MAG: biopolymer transporter ExbD [Oscillatoriales cyanobacterium]|nr:MAG: biopolymer transporter ExbD [Oscillatoriales cyanobacterium]
MKFRAGKRPKKMPTVNLVPMMTAMLAILAFFVVLSTSLTTSERTDVQLAPTSSQEGPSTNANAPTTPPLSVWLDRNGQAYLDRNPIATAALDAAIQAYLQRSPEGTVTLDADPQLPYEQVLVWLERLKPVAGDRITLAIAEPAP